MVKASKHHPLHEEKSEPTAPGPAFRLRIEQVIGRPKVFRGIQ